MVEKLDAETNTENTQGNAKLENAEFTVKYYSGFFDTDPAQQGIQATRTWIFKTNEKGKTYLDPTFLVTGDNFYYTSKGEITLPLGTVTVQETKAPEGYLLNPEMFVRQITSNVIDEVVSTYNAPVVPEQVMKGSVELYKRDSESGNLLSGAVYGIYFAGNEVGRLTTDQNGYAKSGLLPYGNYVLQEITAPAGHVLDKTQHQFKISANGAVVTVNATNDLQKGKIRILKTDVDSTLPLTGAVFEIYAKTDIVTADGVLKHKAGQLVDTVTGGTNGIAETKPLYLGQYTVKEKTAPTGYVQNTAEYSATLSFAGQTVQFATANVTVTNEKQMGVITILKTDNETHKFLPNAVFGIYAKTDIVTPDGTVQYTAGQLVDTVTTNADGAAASQLLYLGTYTVRELFAPDGYVLGTGGYDVTLTYGGQTRKIVAGGQNVPNKRQMGQIVGTKLGEVFIGSDFRLTELGMMYAPIYEQQGLPGAVYEIFAKDDIVTPDGTVKYTAGQPVDTVTTDENGKFTSKELHLGTYVIREQTAPDGYVLDAAEHEVTLTYGGQNTALVLSSVSLQNERQKVQITLKKEMEPNTAYPNPEAYKDVQFGLFAAEDIAAVDGSIALEKGSLLEVITPDETLTGITTMDLPIGSYYLQEIATNEAYLPDETQYPLEFTYAGQDITTVEIVANEGKVIYNELKKGTLRITKKGADNQLLSGAEIEILTTDMQPVIVGTTDDNGQFSCELPLGDYLYREIKAPDGYVLNDAVQPVTITEHGQFIELELFNDPVPPPQTGDSSIAPYITCAVLASGFIALAIFAIGAKKKKQ